MNCFKCKKQANIKINVLKYCNSCFITIFESKIQKNLPKISADKKIFLFLSNSPISLAIYEIICKNFKNRPIKKLEICSESAEIKNKMKYENTCENITISIEPCSNYSDALKYCLDNQFDYLIYGESLNESILKSLSFLCEGQAEEAVKNSIGETYDSLKPQNILLDIKSREIMYYLFLKGIKGCASKKPKNKIDAILADFLCETDERNGLAFFNIQNTFKKLSES